MSQTYYSTVTDIGAALISNAPLLGSKVDIVQIAVGDANGTPYRPTPSMTALKHETWRGTVTKYVKEADNIIIVHGVIPASVGGFVIREVSVIDTGGNTIAIGNTPDLPKVTVEEGFNFDLELRMRIIVTNVEVIECKINPHVTIATLADVNKKTDKIVPAAVGNFACLDEAGNLADAGVTWAHITAQYAQIGKSIPLGDVSDPAITHRNNFRGKNLGSVVTGAQKAAIQNGSFDDLWLGDYWVIAGHTWRIADINYWINCGDTSTPPKHLVIMPDRALYTHVMNDTNITTGGYVGSKMYTEGLAQAKTLATSAFPSMVLSHREVLVNAVSNGYPTAGSWYDSTVELPNEIMMYGSHVFTPAGNGTIVTHLHTIDNSQLALMAAHPRFIKTRETYWLRSVVSAAAFATVHSHGTAHYADASDSRGVRPVFAIG